MTTATPARGRPRPPAPVHLVAMRELTAAMRQARIAATGERADSSVELLNRTIAWLYPEPAGRGGPFNPSIPRTITAGYLRKLERGHHSRLRPAGWVQRTGLASDNSAYASNVPAWLVRAYDVAFGADGYLVDMYRWARVMQEDSEHELPRTTRELPEHVRDGGELEHLGRGFTDVPDAVRAVLAGHAGLLRARRHRAARPAGWVPAPGDASQNRGTSEDDLPEGALVGPGEYRLCRLVLDNVGTVPWADRLLYRVGDPDSGIHGGIHAGIHAPPFVPIPDTPPGGQAAIAVPLRAPRLSGTYRLCLKSGWPNGVYCFPNTLLGVIVTLIVPPADVVSWQRPWDAG